MKPLYRGIAVAVLQCLIVLSVAGKYSLDRERLPRAWAKAVPSDPNLFVRGRYVSLRLQVQAAPDTTAWNGVGAWTPALLSAVGGRLLATPDPSGSVHIAEQAVRTAAGASVTDWVLNEQVAFFIPENVPDPSRRAPGEELWVEVSVPAKGAPRPIRLGVKKNGVLTPLELGQRRRAGLETRRRRGRPPHVRRVEERPSSDSGCRATRCGCRMPKRAARSARSR